jgi:hypothetical protein
MYPRDGATLAEEVLTGLRSTNGAGDGVDGARNGGAEQP